VQEREAIVRLKRGDISGLDHLVREHQVQALRTAMLITRDKALAEDVVQNTFIRVYQKIEQFDESRPFAPWFMRSIANASVQASKKTQRNLSLSEEISDGITFEDLLTDNDNKPDEQLEEKERQELIKSALDKLTPEQRATVVMRYFLDMSEQDMSIALDTPKGTIKWRLHESRKRLRGILQRVITPANGWGG